MGAFVAAALFALSLAGHAAELIVDEAVVVKFGTDAGLTVRDKITLGSAVVMTSAKEGAAQGVPAAGDWRGLRIEKSTGSFGTSTLSGLTVRYAGSAPIGQSGAALSLRAAHWPLQYVQLTDNLFGLRLVDAANPAITGASFLRNTVGLQAENGSNPAVTQSQFVQNSTAGIVNQTPATVIQATGNWWGHTSGPKDPVGNPQGQGDAVSAGVNYGGYLAQAPLLNPSVRLVTPATYYDQQTVLLDLSCVNATEYRVAEGDAFTGVAFVALPDGRGKASFTTSAGDGRKTINVQFRNVSGTLVTASLAGGVLIDTQAPQVSISKPEAGSLLNSNVAIEVSAEDTSGIERVEVYVDNQLLSTTTAAPYRAFWDAGAASPGNHQIKVQAYDLVGRMGEVSQVVQTQVSTDWDAARDFLAGGTNPSKTWSYGYQSTLDGTLSLLDEKLSDSQTLTIRHNISSGVPAMWKNISSTDFICCTNVVLPPGKLAIHPGPAQISVLRWTAPAGGNYQIDVTVFPVTSATTDIWIRKGSVLLQQSSHNGNTITYSSAVDIGAGEFIDVAVGNAGNFSSDNTGIDVKIRPTSLPPDAEGPAIASAKLAGALLSDGLVVERDSAATVQVTDRSGVARVELLLDGLSVATAQSAGASLYSTTFSIASVPNGPHALTWRAADSLNNVNSATFQISVAHALPAAPLLTSPQTGLITRNTEVTAGGSAPARTTVQFVVNGQPAGTPIFTSSGSFSAVVPLASGGNQIQARATDAFGGTGALSNALQVTVDTSVPTAPSNLNASGLMDGKVRLTWTRSTDANAVRHDLYRSRNPIVDIATATRVNSVSLSGTSYDDLPGQEGLWYYRMVAVNALGTASAPTNEVQANADGTAPKAVSVVYAPQGKVDAATGRIGQGRVDFVLTTSEELQAGPYLAIVPAGGTPIVVDMTKTSATVYNGFFYVDATTPSGTANALFSARDLVGNRGTEIQSGATLRIDTEGPALTSIVLNPAAPIKVDGATTVTATLDYSKQLKAGTVPQIKYLLSGAVRQPVLIPGPTQLDATTWRAIFALPTDAGLGSPETISFSSQALDDLDNVSTRVTAVNRFQVYQGSLPPSAVPLGLTGKAQPAGKVKLNWLAVDEAFAYQIYRQGPNQTALEPLVRAAGVEYIDTTPADGKYIYAVASVRQSNGQESLSDKSATVEVQAMVTVPGAPQNLALALTSLGIKATWQAPVASTVDYYNLYRTGGTSVTSIAGVTPIKTRVKSLITYDPAPSPTQSAYVVTAVDLAGNESAMSNSGYLNASLLPVVNPRVLQIGTSLPTVSWTAPNGGVAGYNVYIGPDASRTRLTATPITGTTFIDTGYSSGERRYTIATVDVNGLEIGRSLVLPAVSTQIVSGLPINRGVMNRLQVQVTNTSASSVDNAKVVVRLPINRELTLFKEHRSELFSLGGNQTQLVSVVVGGYGDLPAAPTAQVGIESSPNEGELVKIARNQVVETADSALVVGMSTGEFTRGATGKVRLTVENTSEVEVELLTATSSGTAASSELRLKILDADGNVLATQAYKQSIGANVITLPTGQTVARIPPGTSYTSDVFDVIVPASSPNSIRVKLEVDKLRYHTGQEDEITIAGRGTEKTVSLLDTAYYGELSNVTPISSFGDQDIVITGRAVERTSGQPLPNTRLKLILNQQGFERIFGVLTDATGSFTYVFKPTATDGGLYKVSAIHPDLTDRPEQKSFTINRVVFGPTPYKLDLPRNYSYSVPFFARSGAGTSATNMRFVLEASAQSTGQLPAGVQVQLPNAISIGERAQLNMPVVFSANNEAQPSGSIILNVYSDERPQGGAQTGGAPLGQVRLDYTLSEAKPFLVSTPSLIETGLAQGGSQIETVQVQNKGLQDAINLQFGLTKPDGSPAPEWISLTGQVNGSLAVGERRAIEVAFNPSTTVIEGVYEFRLRVSGDNVPAQALNIYASVTQSGEGNALFRASDIYTATLDKSGNLIQGLAGATVTLQNEDVATVTRELRTDSLGEAYFQGMPAGRYKYRAQASNHQEVAGRLQIKPGITVVEPLFLEYNLITVEWSVREITITDRYEITIDATFETDVPAAVVVMQPSSINLPKMKPGDVFYGELTLTNFGLIRADHVKQKLPPSDPYFRYEFLVELPTSLEPKQRVTIPYRVIALTSLDPADAGGTATGGGCYSYGTTSIVTCDYICKNGVQAICSTRTSWFSIDSNCTTGGGGGSTGGGGGGGYGGGYGAGSGGFGGLTGGTSTPLPPPKGKKCVGIPGGKNSCD